MLLRLVSNLLAQALLVFLIGVAVRTVMDCLGVWAEHRAGRRSLPMALAFTSIITALVTAPVGVIAKPHLPEWVGAWLETGFIGLLFVGGGVLGAFGLIMDRRLRCRSESSSDDDAPTADPGVQEKKAEDG